MSFETIKNKRDEIEKQRLEKVQNEALTEIAFQDSIFSKFSGLYRAFKQKQMQNPGRLFVTKDLKEYWAFWLQKQDFKKLGLNEVDKEFQNFKQEARSILAGNIVHNPYYSILQAEHFLSSNQVDQAKTALNHAITLSKEHAELLYSAHIKLFEVAIETGEQLRERFKKAIKEVIFIPGVEKNEAYKDQAKAALAAAKKALEKEIKYIKKHFLGEELDVQNADVSKSAVPGNLDFIRILTNGSDNLLVKHIVSRLTALNVFYQHTESLLNQIKASLEKKDKQPGLSIKTRIPNYLGKLDPSNKNEEELKQAITDAELSELGLTGLETIYALREVHDAHQEVIARAQGQIGGGLSVLAMGVAFPPSMPAMGPIAGTLISEGICDIAIELISQGNTQLFSETAYIKGKCISYGIAVATMGIGAVAKSTKMLDQAIKACKGLSNMLRKCPALKSVCAKLATQIDKLGKYLEKSKHLIEFSLLNKVEQLSKLEKLKSAGELEKLKHLVGPEKFAQLQHLKELGKLEIALSRFQIATKELVKIGKGTLQGVVGSLISEKLVTKGLEEVLQSLKPTIEKQVQSTIEKKLTEEQLKLVDEKLINDILIGSYGEIATDILKEVALGILRHCNNWKAKIASIAIDSGISITQIVGYTESFCYKLQEQLKQKKQDNNSRVEDNDDKVIALITVQVAEKIYGLIIHLAGKYAHTFVVNPIIHRVWNLCEGTDKKKELSSEEAEAINSFYEIIDDLETLGLKPGASIDEIKKARSKMAFETHPNRNKHDPEASEKFQRVWSAGDRLIVLYSNIPHNNIPPSAPFALPNHNHNQQFARDITAKDIGLEEAHIGHICTLSEREKQCIIVRSQETGKVIQQFGEAFKDQDPMIVSYSPPQEGQSGHFSIPEEVIKNLKKNINVPVLKTPYENNCLYDALVPQFHAQGINISVQELRKKAEEFNFDNFYYGMVVNVSQIFNNPITRSIFFEAQSALLVGGRRRLEEGYYPSHENKIVAGEALKGPLAALRNELNKFKKKAEEFSNSKSQSQHIRHNKSQPCFGTIPDKEEMMMGALEVKFDNGPTLKLMTISGDTPFYTRLNVTHNKDLTSTEEPVSFTWENDGFKFVDSGKPEGNIYDVYNLQETTQKYNKSCAAQKLMYTLSAHMKNNPSLKIEGEIKMAEAWYRPANKGKYSREQVVIQASCALCKEVLPTATGKNFTGNGFNNYGNFNYWNEYSRHAMEILLRLRLASINKMEEVAIISPNNMYTRTCRQLCD